MIYLYARLVYFKILTLKTRLVAISVIYVRLQPIVCHVYISVSYRTFEISAKYLASVVKTFSKEAEEILKRTNSPPYSLQYTEVIVNAALYLCLFRVSLWRADYCRAHL